MSNTTEAPPEKPAGTVTLSITNIARDKAYQFRLHLDAARVYQYAEQTKAGSPQPPVRVAQIGERLVLIDGWHRLAACDSLGITAVEAVVAQRTHKEALRDALAANQSHGVPYNRKEHLPQFKQFIREKLHVLSNGKWMQYEQIRVALGCVRATSTYHGWMKKHYPRTADQMGGRMKQERYDGPTTGDRLHAKLRREAVQHVERYVDEVVNHLPKLTEWDRAELVGRLEALLLGLKSSQPGTAAAPAEPLVTPRSYARAMQELTVDNNKDF